MTINTTELPKNRENWKSIDGYHNYEVSWWGRIRNATTGRIYKNSLNKGGYFVVGLSKNKKFKTHNVHQLVAHEWVDNPDEKRCVDHIDGDRANNHYENLRYATCSENNRNAKKHSNSSSIYKGVCWYEPYKKWYARCMVDRKRTHLGYFETEREAGEAYNAAAVDLHKNFAKLNMLD